MAMKITRKIVSIDEEKCNGCGECVTACAEGAIELVGGKARLVAERYCDGLAACLGHCPQDAISIIERTAEEFDPEAVEEYLAQSGKPGHTYPAAHEELPSGCPSTQLQTFAAPKGKTQTASSQRNLSALTHWPVQIKLVPPTAPFLKNADLLVASDCTPMAYPNFHEDFLKGRVVMMGCPKFDDVNEYVNKFADIFRTAGIRSVTITIMEVPCCSKMPMIIQKAMEIAGKKIPAEVAVINAQGEMLQRTPVLLT